MLRKMVSCRARHTTNYFAVSGLGLAFCLFPTATSAQQNQRGVYSDPVQQDQQYPETQGYPDQGMRRDPQGQGAPNQDMQQGPGGPNQGMQQPPQDQQTAPRTLTIPAGTVIRVRVNDWLSSDRSVIGDEFSAVLDQPIVVDGWVVARRNQSESGRVSLVKKSRGGGTSELGVELREITLVDGQQLPIQTELLQNSASNSNGRNAAIVGATAGVGAVIGAAAGGGPGAAIGAVAGGAAGVVGVFSTPGKPTVIPPETVLSFRLQSAVDVSTEKSQFAFHQVSQADYDSRTSNNRPQRYEGGGAGAPPPPAPYYSPYYYGYPYAYSYPHYPYGFYPVPFAFGFYGGYGFGPRFGGFRGGFRR